MVSGDDEAQVSIVRLRHGDENPLGPGRREEGVDWGQPPSLELRDQTIDFGSFVEIGNSPSLNPAGSFTLALWCKPTLISTRWHTICAKWTPGNLSYAIYCTGQNTLVAAVSHDGVSAHWCTAQDYLELRIWQFVALVYDSESGDASFYHFASDAAGVSQMGPTRLRSKRHFDPGPIFPGVAPLLFGAMHHPTMDGHWAHFNGKLASPILLDCALDDPAILALARGEPPSHFGGILGAWDFSADVTGARIRDASENGNHGRAVNSPGRAVTGPHWQGLPSSVYTSNPGSYDAIHLHEDDLDDARWSTTLELSVPESAPSGLFAARFQTTRDELVLPFVVRPTDLPGPVTILIPTLTWQAYSSNRRPDTHTEDGLTDLGLCIYNVHRDGSMVYYCTRRKPTRSLNPSASVAHSGAHTIAADLYLIDWLDARAIPYDTITDEDLHQEGAPLLSSSQCLILSSHPEYWTAPMIEALRSYLRDGGHVMYLGGNGLYWVTSIDEERPYLMEVRKSGEGEYDPRWVFPEPGELQHSTTLEAGGLWARRGLPPRLLLGVEYSGNVFVPAGGRWGFKRLPASWDSRYGFIFAGVADDVIGDFGLNLGSAAGFEIDSSQEWGWAEHTRPAILARAEHEEFFPPARVPIKPIAEMAITVFPTGGAVFSASSVTWSGSLSHNDYQNNVSRITENVLRRFRDTTRGTSVLDD